MASPPVVSATASMLCPAAMSVVGIVAESRRALDRGSFGVAERALARAEKARSVRTRPERSWAAARNG